MSKPEIKQFSKREYKPKDKKELNDILHESFIDLSIPVIKPPEALKIRDFNNGEIIEKRLFTLSNFSAITGKSKSKKTFLTSVLLAAAAKGDLIFKKIKGCLPKNKNIVLLFDSEQSYHDAYITSERVLKIIGHDCINFLSFGLREYMPNERCDIINFILEKYKDSIGYAVIDGVADLVNAINDEIEALRVTNLLMKWTYWKCNIKKGRSDNISYKRQCR